jgi:hypothetical protein
MLRVVTSFPGIEAIDAGCSSTAAHYGSAENGTKVHLDILPNLFMFYLCSVLNLLSK